MTIYYYRVAGFLFPVRLPADMDAEKLLPSFRPFRTSGCAGDEELLFDFAVVEPDDMPEPEARQLLEETDNDMGHLSLYATVGGYMVEVANNSHTHRITANADFSCVRACLQREDKNIGAALSSMLRIAYAQAILGVHPCGGGVQQRTCLPVFGGERHGEEHPCLTLDKAYTWNRTA